MLLGHVADCGELATTRTGEKDINLALLLPDCFVKAIKITKIGAIAQHPVTGFTTDLRAELRAITVPTLIVHGDRDVQAPIDICGRKSAQLVPNNTFIGYENAAHRLFVTHARRLNADLLAFVQAGAMLGEGES